MACCSCHGVMGVVGKAVVIAALAVFAGVVHRAVKPIETTLKGSGVPAAAPRAFTDAPNQGSAASGAATGGTTSPPTPPNASPASVAGEPALEEGMIPLAEAKRLFDEGASEWVDAREPEEYARGRIGDAYNMPPSAFMGGKVPDAVGVMSRDKTVVVYCGGGSCDASKLVALQLQSMGFRTVVFHDGWKGWTGAGYPVVGSSGEGGG